ncbi:hypothetical protein LOK49_LG11G01318 [Camellia lanceoleosa]|uniref:Uncharacterized protein n=1 Tax=Camellia lanceoleosa TaxID=1840588 RepID=A0ACC0FY58_9ERIC|nr:hypothetical protein LOK49_LG11G01318 [Camellia lanceoleosa]
MARSPWVARSPWMLLSMVTRDYPCTVELSMPNRPLQLLFPVKALALASNCVMVTFLGLNFWQKSNISGKNSFIYV